ncbi:MAG: glycosyl-4,4'-diaponeurosporenoate acyltransferase [Actinomycetota bacterium]|nr:glycosyl-4,4'-diaponeurosporenoate acyltransferase [Actinomycetota bacterium]
MTSWEINKEVYHKIFKVKSWKKFIPDGGTLFKRGFAKKKLAQKSSPYLSQFLNETKRAELTHWLQILPVPVFFLWNQWWVGLIMIAYALLANIPCILLQRHNRLRLQRIEDKR